MGIEQSNSGSGFRSDQIGMKEAIPAAVAAELAEIRKEIAELRAQVPEDKAALAVFSGDLDRAIAAFVIATGPPRLAWKRPSSSPSGGCQSSRRRTAQECRSGT
jgi:hypothetical protein